MNTLVTEINGKKMKMKITKTYPVIRDKSKQVVIPFSEEKEKERKMTLADLVELLETSDFENTSQYLLN